MIKTPYYILDEQELKANVTGFFDALDTYFPNYILGYSFKTNSLPWVIREMKTYGAYAEVVSYDEYHLAQHVGYPMERIIYNGPLKSEETFIEAITFGAIVNIETHRELEWLKKLPPMDTPYNIGIRVNFDIEQHTPGESACGEEGGRFGFCFENGELKKAIDEIQQMPHVVLKGLHMHVSSKTRSLNIYQTTARMSAKIKEEYQLDLSYVDLGGGYFGGMPTKPSYKDYMKVIHKELSASFDMNNITVIVEPGASIIASPFHYVTSVIDVKQTTRNHFVVTDGGRNDIDPLMSKSNYLYDIKTAGSDTVIEKQVISGFTCMEHDRLFELKNHPLLAVGDQITYHKVGSYTMCLSPLFIRYFPDVYVKRDGQLIKIRDKWDVEAYTQGER